MFNRHHNDLVSLLAPQIKEKSSMHIGEITKSWVQNAMQLTVVRGQIQQRYCLQLKEFLNLQERHSLCSEPTLTVFT